MIAFTALWFLFQFHFVFVVANAETKGKLNGDLRIVGGTDADAFPTLAFSKGSRLCGATLIYSEYVTVILSTPDEHKILHILTKCTTTVFHLILFRR